MAGPKQGRPIFVDLGKCHLLAVSKPASFTNSNDISLETAT